jgi:two-component system response regulator RegA
MRGVLVVDDDPGLRAAWSVALSQRGWRAHAVPTLTAARAELSRKTPELCVLDLCVGAENGLELVPEAVAAGARVVVVSGCCSVPLTVAAMRLGASGVYAKPVDIERVLAHSDTTPPAPLRIMSLRRVEWEHIQRALDETAGNISEAARRLGIPRRTLQRKLQKAPPP